MDQITITQPLIIGSILDLVGLNFTSENVKIRYTPVCSNKLLDNNPYGNPRVKKLDYRSIVGFLICDNDMDRPDITMATQQCSRFCDSLSR